MSRGCTGALGLALSLRLPCPAHDQDLEAHSTGPASLVSDTVALSGKGAPVPDSGLTPFHAWSSSVLPPGLQPCLRRPWPLGAQDTRPYPSAQACWAPGAVELGV